MGEQKVKYRIKVKSKENQFDPARADMHKDFDKLYSTYTHWAYRKDWYKTQFHSSRNRKMMMYIIVGAIVAYLVFLELDEKKEKHEIPQNPIEQIDQ